MKRVAINPIYVPTMIGHLGSRRGSIVGSDTIGDTESYLVELDPVKVKGQRKGTVSIPHMWLISEDQFDAAVRAGEMRDPYAISTL